MQKRYSDTGSRTRLSPELQELKAADASRYTISDICLMENFSWVSTYDCATKAAAEEVSAT